MPRHGASKIRISFSSAQLSHFGDVYLFHDKSKQAIFTPDLSIYKVYAESFRGKEHLRQIQEEAETLISSAFKSAGVLQFDDSLFAEAKKSLFPYEKH